MRIRRGTYAQVLGQASVMPIICNEFGTHRLRAPQIGMSDGCLGSRLKGDREHVYNPRLDILIRSPLFVHLRAWVSKL